MSAPLLFVNIRSITRNKTKAYREMHERLRAELRSEGERAVPPDSELPECASDLRPRPLTSAAPWWV